MTTAREKALEEALRQICLQAPWASSHMYIARKAMGLAVDRDTMLALFRNGGPSASDRRALALPASPAPEAARDGATWAVGNLRHLYRQMMNGGVLDTAQAARGLLGPAIEALEPLTTPAATPAAEPSAREPAALAAQPSHPIPEGRVWIGTIQPSAESLATAQQWPGAEPSARETRHAYESSFSLPADAGHRLVEDAKALLEKHTAPAADALREAREELRDESALRQRGLEVERALHEENARLVEMLRQRGVHDRDCGAYRTIGRFGSWEGIRWNNYADPTACTCPLGVAILGCELGKALPAPAVLAQAAPTKEPR